MIKPVWKIVLSGFFILFLGIYSKSYNGYYFIRVPNHDYFHYILIGLGIITIFFGFFDLFKPCWKIVFGGLVLILIGLAKYFMVGRFFYPYSNILGLILTSLGAIVIFFGFLKRKNS